MPTITPSFFPKGRVSIKGTQVTITRDLPLGTSVYEVSHEFKITDLPRPQGIGSGRRGFQLCQDTAHFQNPFIYVIPQDHQMKTSGIRGLSTIPFEGRGLIRPLLNIFFSLFPDITQTHHKFAILPALNLLCLEYGFEPTGDSGPNAWFRPKQLRDCEILFKDGPSRDKFMTLAPATHSAQFSILGIKPEPPAGFWPVTIGSAYVLKDRTAFQRALDKFPVTIET